MNKLIPVLGLVLATTSTLAAAEGVYRWEQNGKVIYSDQPPPNSQAEKVDTHVPGVPRPALSGEAARQQEIKQAIRAQECEKARARLNEYQNAPVLKQRNLKGEERELTSNERIDIIVRAQGDVSELCGDPEEESVPGQAADAANDSPDENFSADDNAEFDDEAPAEEPAPEEDYSPIETDGPDFSDL